MKVNWLWLLYFGAITLMIFLKVQGILHWSWLTILSPWWIAAIMGLILWLIFIYTRATGALRKENDNDTN